MSTLELNLYFKKQVQNHLIEKKIMQEIEHLLVHYHFPLVIESNSFIFGKFVCHLQRK